MEEVLDRFDFLYNKIFIENKYSILDLSEYTKILTLIYRIDEDILPEEAMPEKYQEEMINYQMTISSKNNELSSKYFDSIAQNIKKILDNNLDKSLETFNYENIIDEKNILNEVANFYKTIDFEDKNYINRLLETSKLGIKKDKSAFEINGELFKIDNKNYVYLKYKDVLNANALTCTIHELGHAIATKDIIEEPAICMDPFSETISITLEMIYSRTQNENKIEYLKHQYDRILSLNKEYAKLSKDDPIKVNSGYKYLIGKYLGIYLSKLYMTDKDKFKHLYDVIRKYVYTNEEDKIFEILLQDKEIVTGSFLQDEIVRIQKELTNNLTNKKINV